MGVGDLNLTARGFCMMNNNSGAGRMGVDKAGPSIVINSSGAPIATGWVSWWHWYEIVWDSAATVYRLWVDLASAVTASGATFAPPTAGDYVYIQPNFPAVIAHVGLWNRLLTSTERNVLVGHLTTWPYGAPASYVPLVSTAAVSLSSTDPVVIALQAGSQFTTASQTELDLIRDSVRKTY
jgi:hypothetical protein